MGMIDVTGQIADFGRQMLRTGAYALCVPNLIHMQSKPAAWVFPRYGTTIDEIVLHGTESNVSQVKSLDYLASKNRRQALHPLLDRPRRRSALMRWCRKISRRRTPAIRTTYRACKITIFARSALRCPNGIPMCSGRRNSRWTSPIGSITRWRNWCMTSAAGADQAGDGRRPWENQSCAAGRPSGVRLAALFQSPRRSDINHSGRRDLGDDFKIN